MLVRVRYADNSCGTVDNSIIDRLVQAKEIRAIRRSSGWVSVHGDDSRNWRTERRGRGPARSRGRSLVDIYI